MSMLKKFGIILEWKLSVNIVICISKQMFFSWQMSLKISEAFVWKIMSWTLVGITPYLDLLGMHVSRRREFNLNCWVTSTCCWWLKREFAVESQWFQHDISKLITDIRKILIQLKNQSLFRIWTPTTCMVGRCRNHFLSTTSSGWLKMTCQIGDNFQIRKGKVAFLRMIWSIRKNFIICIMISHLHQRELLWMKSRSWFQLLVIRRTMFSIMAISNNILRWVWNFRKSTAEFHSTKKLGWNHILRWILNCEQRQQTISKKIFSNWWTIQYLEKLWKISEIVLMSDFEQVKSLRKSWFRNQIMNEQQYSVKISSPFIWRNGTCFQQAR